MRLSMKRSSLMLLLVFFGACSKAGLEREVAATSVKMSSGHSFIVDSAGQSSSEEPIRFTAPQDGVLFLHSTTFLDHSSATDLSGIRKVYLFVPSRFVEDAKIGGLQTVGLADGLLATEYSKNYAFPDDFCYQQLSEGTVSLRVAADGTSLVLQSQLKSPPIVEPTDARCDASKFVNTTTFTFPERTVRSR